MKPHTEITARDGFVKAGRSWLGGYPAGSTGDEGFLPGCCGQVAVELILMASEIPDAVHLPHPAGQVSESVQRPASLNRPV